MELKFIEVWHRIISSSQGAMKTLADKVEEALEMLNGYAEEIGHENLSEKQVKNKIDSIKRKAKAVYSQVRVKTTTGSNIEDDYDLEVCYVAAQIDTFNQEGAGHSCNLTHTLTCFSFTFFFFAGSVQGLGKFSGIPPPLFCKPIIWSGWVSLLHARFRSLLGRVGSRLGPGRSMRSRSRRRHTGTWRDCSTWASKSGHFQGTPWNTCRSRGIWHWIARMQNKLCDVTKCLTTVAAGVLSSRDRKKKLETGLLFEVLLLDQQISFGVRLFFVTRCPQVPLVTCQKAQTWKNCANGASFRVKMCSWSNDVFVELMAEEDAKTPVLYVGNCLFTGS